MFAEVTGEKLVRGAFLPPPPPTSWIGLMNDSDTEFVDRSVVEN